MLDYRFTIPQISRMLKVSASTIARRLHEYGLSTSVLFTRMSDQDLDSIIQEISSEFINCGYKRMQGFLVANNQRFRSIKSRANCWRVRKPPASRVKNTLSGRFPFRISQLYAPDLYTLKVKAKFL